MGPIEAVAGQKPHRAAIEASVHAVAVEFDFVEPVQAVRRFLHELRQLRRDPFR